MKKQIIAAIIKKLTEELNVTLASATAAHEAATGEDSRAENQYDTRGLEAGYLAEAQMKRAAQYEQQIAAYNAMLGSASVTSTTVDTGALVELKQGARSSCYFVVGGAGGITVEHEGRTINVITLQSPLADALLGHKAGDIVDVEMQGGVRTYTITKIS